MEELTPEEEAKRQRIHRELDERANEWANRINLAEVVMKIRNCPQAIDTLMRLAFSQGVYVGACRQAASMNKEESHGRNDT